MRRKGTRSTPRHRLPAASAAIVAAATSLTALAGTAAAEQAPATGARPGDVVSAEPSAYRLPPGFPTPTDAWKIHYRSTDATGRPDVVSGTVIVPQDGRTGTRPVLTYAVGTVGMGDQCAPSAAFPKGDPVNSPLLNQALLRGWAVAVTDYQGLGTPGDHTYLVGRAEGTAVLDAARAAERLPQAQKTGVTASSPVAVMGYSQGGQASGWAAELARSYAPDLHVKGVAAGGVPADLLSGTSGSGGGSTFGLELMTAIGHDAAYPELNLDKYLNDDGRALVAKLRDSCVVEASLETMGKNLDDLTVSDPLKAPDWIERLKQDRLGDHAPAYPVYLWHGTADQIVSYGIGEQLRTDWCSRGATVQWRSYPLADHMGAAVLGAGTALDWLAARLADDPAQGNCG
ncbi:lipase family protein [Actinomadura opuntiae]|uniref:lipase family protein n=1 Tax=Actinomadura sp. OS1-43 TaxID=604315 RepID=UPI00255AB0AF|nr:lipase family protein [Actinomadura sp. OS1-43]MDL4813437.1 lipase family protein [Actinomadura sp. OS1-43]